MPIIIFMLWLSRKDLKFEMPLDSEISYLFPIHCWLKHIKFCKKLWFFLLSLMLIVDCWCIHNVIIQTLIICTNWWNMFLRWRRNDRINLKFGNCNKYVQCSAFSDYFNKEDNRLVHRWKCTSRWIMQRGEVHVHTERATFWAF